MNPLSLLLQKTIPSMNSKNPRHFPGDPGLRMDMPTPYHRQNHLALPFAVAFAVFTLGWGQAQADSVDINVSRADEPDNPVTITVKMVPLPPKSSTPITVSSSQPFEVEYTWTDVYRPGEWRNGRLTNGADYLYEYLENPIENGITHSPVMVNPPPEDGITDPYVRRQSDGFIKHYILGTTQKPGTCGPPGVHLLNFTGACTIFSKLSSDPESAWVMGPPSGPRGDLITMPDDVSFCSGVEKTTIYQVRLSDPNGRQHGGGCRGGCRGPTGGDTPGGGGEAGGGSPSFSLSQYRESFGSGAAPGSGAPTGPIQASIPFVPGASGSGLTPSMFTFHPAIAGSSQTMIAGTRVIQTPHSRVEIQSVGEGVEVRIFDDTSTGAAPTHVRAYSRVTDADLGTGLRLTITERDETNTYDWFESVSLDGLSHTWKEVRDGIHITFGVATLVPDGNGGATRIVETFSRLLMPDGSIETLDRNLEQYAPDGLLVQSVQGIAPNTITTSTYEAGRLSHWTDMTGQWEKHLYDSSGELVETLSPWLNSPASPTIATRANSRSTVYSGSSTLTYILGQALSTSATSNGPSPVTTSEKGTWNADNKTFTPTPNGTGAATRSTYRDGASPVANKSTRSVTISDDTGTRRSDLEVFTGGTAYALLTRTDYIYEDGRLSGVLRDGDVVSSTDYHANGTRTVTGEDGSSVTYSAEIPESDDATQIWSGGEFAKITNTSTTVGNTTTHTRSAGGLAVSSSSTSTAGGRLLSSTDELGRTTNYTYTTSASTGQRTETETGPGGVTRITTYHRDGQIKSITGSGVVPEFYEYSVSGGLLVTTVRLGAADSPRLRRTHTNGNGQLKREEIPLPGGRTLARIYHYDTHGRLVRVQCTGLADELTAYNTLGQVYRRGLDIDGNGTLDPASSDRIVETEYFYENDGDWVDDGGWEANGDCWEITLTSTYLSDGNATKTLLSGTGRRIGLGAESITETRQPGNRTITTTTTVNRADGTTTVTADANFSDVDAVSIYSYGRLVEQGSFTVAARTKYFYDALGRVRFIKDPRTGLETEIGLNSAGQQLSITRPDPDGAGPLGPLVTEYGYYPATHPNAGELQWSEDGLNKRTYRAYNTRGQLTHQWGPGTYPLRHVYDAYGAMTGLHTWRGGDAGAWNGATLPAAFNASAPDTTTWVYDPASGLLLQKQDATGRGPTYTYRDSGLLQTRSWARGIVTTYGWTPAGDLATVSYSDDTPDVTRTYRRDGSLATVTDAAGTTTYAYNGTLASGESIQGGLLNDLTLSYPQSQGRRQSFTATLGGDTVSLMGYGYDTYGRLESVTEPGIGTNGFAAVFGYVPNSDLPYTTTSKAGATTVLTGTRGYDAADRLTSIGYARPGNTVVTSHGYLLDAADRRTRANREDGTAWSYGYNDRDEVTSAVKLRTGEELLAGWQQAFDYDNLGNRKWTREGGNAAGSNRRETVYTPNALNQYTSIIHPNAFDVLGRAPSDVSVTVNEQPVTRQGEFWRREVGDLPNALAAVWQSVQVDAVDPGAGPNGADVPARRSGNRFVPMAVEAPAYDLDGNLVSDARWIYGWNGENQLIEMAIAAPALAAGVPRERYRYVYDSRSRRIGRTVERWDLDTGAWVVEKNERFVYDDWNVVAVVDAAGEVVQRYAWGNDLSGTPQGAGGVGGLLAAADAASGRSWCYAYDGNGNVSAVVDLADGTKVGRYEYDAFGRTIASWGDEGLAEVNEYRFSTKPLEGTGLYYYGFRWYADGRWVSRDPIEEEGGMNLYGFVRNDGIGKIDILGESITSSLDNGTLKYVTPELVELLKEGFITTAQATLIVGAWGEADRLAQSLPEERRSVYDLWKIRVAHLNMNSCQPVLPVFEFFVNEVYKTHKMYLGAKKSIFLHYDGLFDKHPLRRAKRFAATEPVKRRWRASLRENGNYDTTIYDPFYQQVDEFPYASTVEGGLGAAANPVVIWQNKVHGWVLQGFYKLPLWKKLPAKAGDGFTVILIPNFINPENEKEVKKYISDETKIGFSN
jgi:RHS repeat-associated protein